MDSVSRSGIMLTAEEKNELQKGFRLTQIVWIALLASLGLYIAMAHFVAGDVREGMNLGEQLNTVETILMVAAVITFISIKYLRARVLQAKFSGTVLLEIPPVTRGLRQYTTAMIVALALAESIGVYGLVLFMMGSNFLVMYGFMAYSAVAMYINRPKYDEVGQLVLAMKGRT